MSEYWKSLPRKFCDICKCWFADNKASIDFHERGKRHQENAQKRIQDIQKKGLKDFKKQKQMEDDMAKIERAALAAYKKDLQNNTELFPTPELTLNLENRIAETTKKKEHMIEPVKKKKEKVKAKKKDPSKKVKKNWYEAMSDEGHKYYWNSETSETQWEPPVEGYVNLKDQEMLNSQSTAEADKSSTDGNLPEKFGDTVHREKSKSSIGPQPKVDPYGQWITVQHEEPEEIDLQLPKPAEDIVEVVIPILRDEPRLKFKEKVIGQLTDTDPSEEVRFKKRKFVGSLKRNTRQRTEDD